MIAAIVALAGFLLLLVGTVAYHTAMTTAFVLAALWYWGIYHLALWMVGRQNDGWALLIAAVVGTGLLVAGVVEYFSGDKNTRESLDG
jgi:hypothetical protein